MPGYNLRPLEMEGALGIEQLKKMDKIISQRKTNAKYFVSQMSFLEGYGIQLQIEESSWFGFAIILKGRNKGKRSELVKFLDKNNIDARPIVAGNFVRNKAIEYLDYEKSKFYLDQILKDDPGSLLANLKQATFKCPKASSYVIVEPFLISSAVV